MNNYNKIFFFCLLVIGLCAACDPYEEDGIDIGLLPEAPTFTATPSADNANRRMLLFHQKKKVAIIKIQKSEIVSVEVHDR